MATLAAAIGGGRSALHAVPGAAPGALEWPLPCGPWRRAVDPDTVQPECQVQLDARRFVNGRLLAIDLRHGFVRWTGTGNDAAITLPFSAFRCLRLMALLAAEPPDSPGWRPPPAAVPYRLQFVDGRVWSGSTYRAGDDAHGLFLFEPVDDVGNLRQAFVPRSAWRSLGIGGPQGSAEAGAAVGAEIRGGVPKGAPRRKTSARLGQVLIDLGLIDRQQLQSALAAQGQAGGLALGELLVRQGALTRDGLELALATKARAAIGAIR